MAAPLIQECSWPGVRAVESCEYTIQHGITPGTAYLRTYPQNAAIASYGDLVIGDGRQRVTLKDCRVLRMTSESGPEGQTWTLEIQDRRWRWPGLGAISGSYNQLDNHGKLVPWTIRSPKELAQLCLDAMGQTNAVVDLPDGLPRSAGANTDKYLQAGENFAQTLTNPETYWDHTPPAQALANLADLYGCRLIYQPLLDRIIIARIGVGGPLPDGPCEAVAGGFDNPRIPAAVAVAGAPVRIQARFALEAVGEEWNGMILPIDELSYTPKVPAQVQIMTATYTGVGNPPAMSVDVLIGPGADNAQTIHVIQTGGTVATKLAGLATQLNANAVVSPVLTASSTATTLVLTGKNGGVAFGATVAVIDPVAGDSFLIATTQLPGPPNGRSWRNCPCPLFPTVEQTKQLSYSEAVALAQKSVYRMYRFLFVDPNSGKPPYKLPWYRGKLLRRQQILLQSTKVAQVVPSPRQPGVGNKNNPVAWNLPLAGLFGGGVLPEFYSGYSRDQAATVTGSVSKFVGRQVNWAFAPGNTSFNTKISDRVYADFAIDPFEQTVTFTDYVYALVAGMPVPAALTLETACNVTDAETGQLVRWEESLPLGGIAPIEWQMRNDVTMGVIGTYKDDADGGPSRNVLAGFEFAPGDQADAKGRAGYYLRGAAAQYQLPASDSRVYIGIAAFDPDGAIQQISWSVGPGGATTHASLNTEFAVAVPNYPTRRRAENLPPNQLAILANQLERANAAIPKPLPIGPRVIVPFFGAV